MFSSASLAVLDFIGFTHDAFFYTAALLQYTVSVVGTLPNGQASPAANTLPMIMPDAG